MPEPIYTTPADVRAVLGVDNTVLPDDKATALIQDCEDAIDRLLGGWPLDQTTGRKIVQTSVRPWQWTKLARATAKLAAKAWNDPDLLSAQRFQSEQGRDVTRTGPSGPKVGRDVIALLDDSGLRLLAGRATSGRRRLRPDFARFLAATRHDGT